MNFWRTYGLREENKDVIILENSGFSMRFGTNAYLYDAQTRQIRSLVRKDANGVHLGDDALSNYDSEFCYPINGGQVSDWDLLKQLWAHAFSKLNVTLDRPLVFVSHLLSSPSTNERIVKELFESFPFPHICLVPRTTTHRVNSNGLLVDVGETVTTIVPIFEHSYVMELMQTVDIGGRDITNYLRDLLCKNGYELGEYKDREIVRKIKETYCFVSLDYDNAQDSKYIELEENIDIDLSKECLLCPEVLFRPSLIGKNIPGLVQVINKVFSNIPIHMQSHFSAVHIIGGSSLFPGMAERLAKEIRYGILNEQVDVNSYKNANENWREGSSLYWGKSSDFATEMCISREQFETEGPSIVHKHWPQPIPKRIPTDKPLIIDTGRCRFRAGFVGASEPNSLYSLISLSASSHGGVCCRKEELVGENAFKCDRPYAEIQPILDSDDPSTIHHLVNWACSIAKGEDYPSYDDRLPPIYLVTNAHLYDRIFHKISKQQCLENIENGIVVDFGHTDFIFYAIENHRLIDSLSMGFGGEKISELLYTLLGLQGEDRLFNLEFTGTFVQNQHCQVSRDLKKTLKELGYKNVIDDTNVLANNEESFINKLPSDILQIVQKICVNDLSKETPDNPLPTLGWHGKPLNVIEGKHVSMPEPYKIEWEHFGVTEVMFNHNLWVLHDCQTVPQVLTEFTNKHAGIKDIILTGGMVKCPGFVERLADEVKALNLELKVDENFIWKQAEQIVSKYQ